MKLIYTLVFIQIVLVNLSWGQNIGTIETKQRIGNYLSALETVGFHGSVLVALDGEIVVSKGYGLCDRQAQLRNSDSTIYDLGSITKQFTAAAILKLEMQGKLSTGDTLSKYFPDIPGDKQNITLHDLLRHQSGLVGNVGTDYEKISEAEFLHRVFSSQLRFEIGSAFSYSNIGYSLLAIIIEKVSGKSYEMYLYENLWKPARMETTGYTRPDFDVHRIAVGYDRDDQAWGRPIDREWDQTAPYLHLKGNGGILSTLGDLYKWHIALRGDDILSEQAKGKLYHPQLRAGESESSYYAYGWDVSKTDRNTTQLWHNGTNHIFYADVVRYIDEDAMLIMLSNQYHPNFNGLNRELSRIIFDEEYSPEIPTADNESNRGFTRRIIKTLELSGLPEAKEEYRKKKNHESLLEFMMREEGFNRLDSERPEEAMRIFEMNVFVYPESYRSLQGLAEGYMETGKDELALNFFRQSLRINPDNAFVKDMIRKLDQ
ncbi:MAG: serine hydrolase domain-containing protein [Bacteroidota bacterium]